MTLSDIELAMLEQLCYLDHNVTENLDIEFNLNSFNGKDGYINLKIKEILQVFDEDKLKNRKDWNR